MAHPDPKSMPLRLSTDIGGTFTDVALEQGPLRWTCKVPTTPSAPEDGALNGMRQILAQAGRTFSELSRVVHGTTLPTNAVIERRGAKTALITTHGFRDVLEIGTEGRYDQYEMALIRPRPLVERPLRLTVDERMDARGEVIQPLDEAQVAAMAGRLDADGVESVAVVFLHAYRNPAHERRVRELLQRALPHLHVSLSSEICPEIREYERTSTTVINAYIQPVVADYLQRLQDQLKAEGFQGQPLIMTSGGTLTSFDLARRFPVRLIESGPAGGALFAAHAAAVAGERQIMAFDMGGTTAKLCLITDSAPEKSRWFEADRAARFQKGSGLPIKVPVIDLVEIGAGGGSIASVDALQRVRVGPRSAGSVPGPACFQRGGTQPTVTDADLFLGLLAPDAFAGGTMQLSLEAATQALDQYVAQPLKCDPFSAAQAIYETVCESMASAARVHAVEKGASIGRFTLIASGGAAPLHAARVAEKIGIQRILVPPDAGVGSAVGFLRAPIGFETVRTLQVRLDQFDAASVAQLNAEMRQVASANVEDFADGFEVEEKSTAYMRYIGQGHEIAVDVTEAMRRGIDAETLRGYFEAAYRNLFERVIPGAGIELVSWSVEVASRVAKVEAVPCAGVQDAAPEVAAWTRLRFGHEGEVTDVPCYDRARLSGGAQLTGPALIVESQTTTYISPEFDASIHPCGSIVMRRRQAKEKEAIA